MSRSNRSISRRQFAATVGAGAFLTTSRRATAQDAAGDVAGVYRRSIVIDALANPGSMNVSWPPRGPLSKKQREAIASSGQGSGAPTFEMLMRQIDHALKVCGTDHVGIGSDLSTAPIEETPEYLREAKSFVEARISRGISAPDESRPLFIPELNHSRRIEGVARGLQQRRYPAAVIEKVIGGNFHRVFKETWNF